MTVETGPSITEVLNGKSRTSIAHKAHAEATEAIEILGGQLRSKFEELRRAEKQMAAVGSEVTTTFADPVQVAWDSWKRAQENKESVREEMDARARSH